MSLPEEEAARFRRMYCGMCRTLSERCGGLSRWILNYDFTYLAILLSDGEEAMWGRERCIAHPLREHDYLRPTPAMELAADESVILAYWKLRDGAQDERGAKRLACRVSGGLFLGAYEKAAEKRPGFDRAVRRELAQLQSLETEQCASLDRPADAFALLLRSAAENVAESTRRRVLEQIFYHLGRWVYLIDAADDLKEDAASGNYNPVALRYGLREGDWTAEARRDFMLTLDHSIHMMGSAMALWDFGVWTPILESMVYTSLFQMGRAVLDGSKKPGKVGKTV